MMPRTIRFHLDEHIDVAVAQGLRRRGIDVTTTDDTRLVGADDPEHIAFAVGDNWCIIPACGCHGSPRRRHAAPRPPVSSRPVPAQWPLLFSLFWHGFQCSKGTASSAPPR